MMSLPDLILPLYIVGVLLATCAVRLHLCMGFARHLDELYNH